LALVLIAGAAYFFLAHNRARAAATKNSGIAAVPVIAGAATTRDLPVALTGIGTVQPLSVVDVKARVDGQLERVAFTEGQEVRAGELLAQIDPRPFQAQLAQAQANRAKDEAQLANARLDSARMSKLSGTGVIPAQSVDAAAAQVATLEATVRADEAAMQTAKLQLGFTRLVSPIDGRVGLRLVNPGAIVHASDATGIVTVTQMHPISVLFSLPQDELPDILASASKSKLHVVAYTRDGARSLAEGELSVIDSQIDPTNGQVRMKATFVNANRALWPGALVSARLLVRTDHGATVVPSRAVLRGQNGEYVYVIKSDKTVEMRPVTTGQSVDGFTALRSGVSVGEVVVFDGQTRLAPGTKVDAKEEAASRQLARQGNIP
jgi:multidrug efflux system membrane fusion protein